MHVSSCLFRFVAPSLSSVVALSLPTVSFPTEWRLRLNAYGFADPSPFLPVNSLLFSPS